MSKKIISIDYENTQELDGTFSALSEIVDKINLDMSLLKRNLEDHELYINDIERVMHDNYMELNNKIDNKITQNNDSIKHSLQEELRQMKKIIDDVNNVKFVMANNAISDIIADNKRMNDEIKELKAYIDKIR